MAGAQARTAVRVVHCPGGGIGVGEGAFVEICHSRRIYEYMEQKVGQIALWLADKKATAIKALDLRGISPLTEAVIVVTARSARHAQALADELMQRLGEHKWEYLGVEGMQNGQWVLVDCNDVIVHIFQDETRTLYNIEGLYVKAPILDLPEAVTAGEEK